MAPGKEELGNAPFVGPSGRVLASAASRAGLRFDRASLINTINCYPAGKGDTITPEQRRACSSRLAADLAAASPRVLVALGNDALLAATGFKGTGHGISAWRGYIILPGEVIGVSLPHSIIAVVPAYHPAYIIRTGLSEYPWLVADIRKAVEVSKVNRKNPFEVERWSPPPFGTLDEIMEAPAIAIDTETGRGEGVTLLGLSTSNRVVSLPLAQLREAELPLARPSLKIIHNASFDIPQLEAVGIPVNGPLWDTLMAQQVIDPDAPGFSLNEIASFWLPMARWKHVPGRSPKVTKLKEWKKPFTCACGWTGATGSGTKDNRICGMCTAREDTEALDKWRAAHRYYNAVDAAVLPPIYEKQRVQLHSTGQLERFEYMMKVTRGVLIPMQQRGLKIDPVAREEAKRALAEKLVLATRLWEGKTGGVNPASIPALRKLLYEEWGLPPQRTRDGKLSTDNEALNNLLGEDLPEDIRDSLKALRDIRRSSKWIGTYANIGDRIYPAYGPVGKDTAGIILASTGRILAKGSINPDGTKTPPLQQIPDELRNLIIPDDGRFFVGADYESQELRIIAAKSQCARLLSQLEDGEDIHEANSQRFKCDRTRAKNVFYAWVFGGTPRSAQRALRLQGFMIELELLQDYYATLNRLYPEIPLYHVRVLTEATTNGWLANSFGRRRIFPGRPYRDHFGRLVHPHRNEILNFPIQSDGADIGWDIIWPTNALAMEHWGFLSIALHDGFYWQVASANVEQFIEELRPLLEKEWPMIAPGFKIPVTISTGQNWRDLVMRK